MNAIERRIEELHQYRPEGNPPADFAAFWLRTQEEALGKPYTAERVPMPTLMPGVEAYAVTYMGYNDTPIHGTLLLPAWKREAQYPCMITFPGYTGSRGEPEHYAHWILMGLAVFAVDARGQGGETGDRLGSGHGQVKGWVTEGILDLERCYYKALSVDVMRAVDWISRQPEIDVDRLGVAGASQGGGLALLATALCDAITWTVADIPNMCHIDFGVLHSTGSLSEAAEFCRRYPQHMQTVFEHLSYFDLLHLADRIRVPLMMSVGLKDSICHPEQIFPLFHAAASAEKQLEIYPFTGHQVEHGQARKAMQFIHDHVIR